MNKFVLGMLALSSSIVFAQVDFDHKAERKRLDAEMDARSEKKQKLYNDLNADGTVDPAVQAEIDNLNKVGELDSAKMHYLWSLPFENMQDKYRTSDNLKHFKRASNRFAAVVVKDSKGQIIGRESLGDLIEDLYSEKVTKEYACYEDEDEDEEAETMLPYDEDEIVLADEIMQSVGYANYKEMMTVNQKTYCAINEASNGSNTEVIECNDFISGVRISLLKTLEDKVIQKSREITRVGYLNASDELFKEYDVISDIVNDVEEQISNIEVACINKKLKENHEVYEYIESEVEKGGVTIEYTNINIKSSSVKLK